jgi:hypothetical protein
LPFWFRPWPQRRTCKARCAAFTARPAILLAQDADTFTLRWEDDPQMTDTGNRPIWILRHTTNPEGYCLGRTDWPSVRCEDQQLRCDAPVS